MKLIQEPDKLAVSTFLAANPGISGAEFLLSPDWQELIRREGAEVSTLAVVRDLDYGNNGPDATNFLALAVLIKKSLNKRFFYWYGARSPLLKTDLSQEDASRALKLLLSGVRRLNRRSLFLKIEPASGSRDFWQTIFPAKSLAGVFKVRPAADVQPRRTLVLNLNLSDEELLAQMHQKTRYNIRLAEKKGVRIVEGSLKDFSEFWRLMQDTGGRDGFRLHEENHYKNFLVHGQSNFIRLFFAEYEGQKVATALLGIFGRKAVYLHGGSDHTARQAMAPYLLQWEMIRQSRASGAKTYDFYGVDEERWPGVTRFKRGFGGEEREYPGTFDVVFRPALYSCYQLVKRIRAKLTKHLRAKLVKRK